MLAGVLDDIRGPEIDRHQLVAIGAAGLAKVDHETLFADRHGLLQICVEVEKACLEPGRVIQRLGTRGVIETVDILDFPGVRRNLCRGEAAHEQANADQNRSR